MSFFKLLLILFAKTFTSYKLFKTLKQLHFRSYGYKENLPAIIYCLCVFSLLFYPPQQTSPFPPSKQSTIPSNVFNLHFEWHKRIQRPTMVRNDPQQHYVTSLTHE